MKLNLSELKKMIREAVEEMDDTAPLPPHLDVGMNEGEEEGEVCDCCDTEECTCDCTFCGGEDDDDMSLPVSDEEFMEPVEQMPHADVHDELEDSDEDHHSQELHMVRAELMKISDAAKKLCDLLEDGEEIPAWVQSKVATAADKIDAVFHYMEYKHIRK